MGALIKILAVVMLPLNFTLFVLARSNAVPVGLTDLALFRLRGIRPSIIIDAAIRLHKVGLMVEIEELQRHVMSGGDLPSVTSAAVSVSRSRLKFSFEDFVNLKETPETLIFLQNDFLCSLFRCIKHSEFTNFLRHIFGERYLGSNGNSM